MTTLEILDQLRHLPPPQRLAIVESALHELRQELTPVPSSAADQMQRAAAALANDYAGGSDLTAFTALDGEQVHA